MSPEIKPAQYLGVYGYACGACGNTMSPQAAFEEIELRDRGGQTYRQYRRYMTCSQQGCPQVLVQIPFPKFLLVP